MTDRTETCWTAGPPQFPALPALPALDLINLVREVHRDLAVILATTHSGDDPYTVRRLERIDAQLVAALDAERERRAA